MIKIKDGFRIPKLRFMAKMITHHWNKVLLDVECNMRNWPLCCQEQNTDDKVWTPNIPPRGKPSVLLKEDMEIMDETPITRRLQFVKQCKNNHNKWWFLEERPHKKTKHQTVLPILLAVLLLKEDTKNKAQLRIHRIIGKIRGSDGIIGGFKIKLGNGYIVEWPVQMTYNMEIGSMMEYDGDNRRNQLNEKRETKQNWDQQETLNQLQQEDSRYYWACQITPSGH